jgi:zinc transport system ATP-binding protein
MDPLVKIENLSVGYDKVPILENANLEIFEKDFIGVIGPNGGGKTTLLKAILGLLKPFSGTINFRKDLNGKKKPIGYLPQVRHIDRKFPISVFDVVRSGSIMESAIKSKSIIKERVEQLLDEMGVADHAADVAGGCALLGYARHSPQFIEDRFTSQVSFVPVLAPPS